MSETACFYPSVRSVHRALWTDSVELQGAKTMRHGSQGVGSVNAYRTQLKSEIIAKIARAKVLGIVV